MRMIIFILIVWLVEAMIFFHPPKAKQKMVYNVAGPEVPDTTIVHLDSINEQGWFKMGQAVHLEDYVITGGEDKRVVVVDDSCRAVHFGTSYFNSETIAIKTNGHWKILDGARFLQAKQFLMESVVKMRIRWRKQNQDSM
jgi:hypothetical protein